MSFFEAVTPLSERSGDDARNFRCESRNPSRRKTTSTMAYSRKEMSVSGAADSRERKTSFSGGRNSRERRWKAAMAAQTEAFSGGAISRRASFLPLNHNLSDDSFRSDLTEGGGGGGGKRRSSKTAVAVPQFYRGNHGEVSPIRVRPLFMTRYPLHRRLNAAAAASSVAASAAAPVAASAASATASATSAAAPVAAFPASAASAGSHSINDPPDEQNVGEAGLFRTESVEEDQFHNETVDGGGFHAETADDEDRIHAETNELRGKENDFERRRSSMTTGRTLYSHVMHRVKTFGGGAGEECRRSSVIPEPPPAHSATVQQEQQQPQQGEQRQQEQRQQEQQQQEQQQQEQLQLQHLLDERQLAMWLEKIRRRKAYRSPFSALLPAGGGGGGSSGGSSGASTGEERDYVSDDDEDEDEHYDEDEETSTSFYTDAISATPSRMLTFLLPEDFEASAPIHDPFKSPQSGGGGGVATDVGGRRRMRGIWSELSETSS